MMTVMTIRIYILTAVTFLASFACLGQTPADTVKTGSSLVVRDSLRIAETYSDVYLDTVQVNRVFEINDYSLIGVEYGVSFSRMNFNPPYTQSTLFAPNTFGIFYTRYGKMFSYLPYFGFKIGLRYSHEGYKFKENKETHVVPSVEGATQAIMEVVEVPFMAHLHMDGLHYKVMADAGIYGGYRLNVKRTGEHVDESILNSFKDTDRRLDYGISAGIGFGLVFDPFEFHINANVRYSWGTIYNPDYYSKDYYRFAYPLDVMVTTGVYFQLTRRTGRGKSQLKREAYRQVFNSEEK